MKLNFFVIPPMAIPWSRAGDIALVNPPAEDHLPIIREDVYGTEEDTSLETEPSVNDNTGSVDYMDNEDTGLFFWQMFQTLLGTTKTTKTMQIMRHQLLVVRPLTTTMTPWISIRRDPFQTQQIAILKTKRN
jgi:hypothetical protein